MTTAYPEGDGLDTGFPDTVDDAYPERERVPDPQEAALPGDDYLAVDNFGTTVQEQIEGESLDTRLAQEEPEPYVDPLAPTGAGDSDASLDRENRLLSDPEGASVGRLVEPDQGAGTDLEKDVIAAEARGSEYDLSAEEAAMHVESET